MTKILISTKDIIKRYNIPYSRINYLTKKGALKVARRSNNKRLYNLEDIDTILSGKKNI